MNNPVKVLSTREKIMWALSVLAVVASNVFAGETDLLTLIAAVIGVSSLVFAAKGHVAAPALMIVFGVLYAVISCRFRYWGEMMTYLGMALPMAVWALITWVKNPSEGNAAEVAIGRLSKGHLAAVTAGCLVTTVVFYLLLKKLSTPNLLFSTVSVATSFYAAALTALRSPWFALVYASNDLVLVILWVLASLEDVSYIPVAVNFTVFFFYDVYGFVSWKKREQTQQ